MLFSHHPTQKTGFTLIEVLITIAIIGILGTIVLTTVNNIRDKARIAKAEAELDGFRSALELLAHDTEEWPGHQAVGAVNTGANNEVWDLSVASAGLTATDGNYIDWDGPYVETIQLDPWGNPYFFDTDYDIDPSGAVQNAAALGSFGPNGVGQNLYDDDDVINILFEE